MPITDYCDRYRLDLKARLELFRGVCDGVQHAHQKGILHRDLKPANVLVSEEDGSAAAKLIDFGIAKGLDRPLAEGTVWTQDGGPLGTPAYASPEALAGTDVDTRSDVYSLGCMLYELAKAVRLSEPGGNAVDRCGAVPPEIEAQLPECAEGRAPSVQAVQ